MICNELVRLVVDNDCLEEKLNFLQNEKKKSVKYSKRYLSNPFTAKRFEKKKPKYKVNSKIDLNYISERHISKFKINEKKKKEMELNDCTFKPQINIKSLRIIENKFGKKKPILRKAKNFTKKKIGLSSLKVKNLTVNNKINKNFYERQAEWAKRKNDKLKGKFEKKNLEENISEKNLKKQKSTYKKNNFEDKIKNFSDFEYFKESINFKKKSRKKKTKIKRKK